MSSISIFESVLPSVSVLPMHALSPPRPPSPLKYSQTLTKAKSYSTTTTTTTLTFDPITISKAKSYSTTTQPFHPKISTKTHLSNLQHLLTNQSSTIHPPPPNPTDASETPKSVLTALNLSTLFPNRRPAEEMSPRSIRRLSRLLSDSSRPSPRDPIASRWREFHGINDWSGLLDPLNQDLRRELVRYGELVQSAYQAYFHAGPTVTPGDDRPVPLPDDNYRVVRGLFATSSIEVPGWVPGVAPWAAQRSSWVGYVAVCDNEREIRRVGRRDIVIALRGTVTCLEWAENLRADMVPIETTKITTRPRPERTSLAQLFKKAGPAKKARVERGFWSLYKTPGADVPSLSSSVVGEVRRLMEQYKGEELSITVTGHSLGAALAVLVADELAATCGPRAPPIAVFSFGGPRVGNRAFADRVEGRGVKVLRVVNAHDVVTRVPGVPVLTDGYEHVGRELRVDSRLSPYLKPNADPACCHDLEAYLHLVDGFLASNCPFRANAKRSLTRLLNQQGSNLKQKYMVQGSILKRQYVSKLNLDPVQPVGFNGSGYLASPS